MDKDIWITPTQAREYGLIDEIVGAAQEPEEEPAAFVAAAGRRIRLTAAMRSNIRPMWRPSGPRRPGRTRRRAPWRGSGRLLDFKD